MTQRIRKHREDSQSEMYRLQYCSAHEKGFRTEQAEKLGIEPGGHPGCGFFGCICLRERRKQLDKFGNGCRFDFCNDRSFTTRQSENLRAASRISQKRRLLTAF